MKNKKILLTLIILTAVNSIVSLSSYVKKSIFKREDQEGAKKEREAEAMNGNRVNTIVTGPDQCIEQEVSGKKDDVEFLYIGCNKYF